MILHKLLGLVLLESAFLAFFQLPVFNFLLYLYFPSPPSPNKNHHPWAFLTTLSLTAYALEINSYISCPLLAPLTSRCNCIFNLHPEIPTDTSNSKCQTKYNSFPTLISPPNHPWPFCIGPSSFLLNLV